MIKFVTLPSATIGAKQVAVEAKEKTIEELTRRKENEIKPEKQKDYQEQIDKLKEEITLLFTAEDGLYALMHKAAVVADNLFQDHKIMEDSEAYQAEIEHEFTMAMGDMLKDGYWANNNYALGQEEFLYQDALDMMQQVSRPQISYSVSVEEVASAMGMQRQDFDLNTQIRLYDPEIPINDLVYVTKRTLHLDRENQDKIEIGNDDIT